VSGRGAASRLVPSGDGSSVGSVAPRAVEECSALRSRVAPLPMQKAAAAKARNNSCAKVKSGCVIGAPAASLTRR